MSCEFTKKYLNDKGVKYEDIDVINDKETLDMLRDKGYAQLPVVDIDGEFHVGFQPSILAKVEVV